MSAIARRHALVLLRRGAKLSVLGAAVSLVPFVSAAAVPHPGLAVRASAKYGALPLSFEANEGQTAAQVKFLARGPGYGLFLTSNDVVLRLNRRPAAVPAGQHADKMPIEAPSPGTVLRIQLVGANPNAAIAGFDELPNKSNYFIGNDPSHWQVGVHNFAKVGYHDVYRGVNMVFYGHRGELEYDVVLAPGADLRKVRFRVSGARHVRFNGAGDLVLSTVDGDVTLRQPVASQQEGQTKHTVAARYRRLGAAEFGFAVTGYNPGLRLTIDPVLAYSTYLGGNGGDIAYGIAVNSAGEAYIAGVTGSANFPIKSAAQPSAGGDGDAFISKLDAKGSGLIYSTYLGGSGMDSAAGITIDSAGDAYVTGATASSNFPVTATAFQNSFGGVSDAFVAEVGPDGSALVYASYLGGNAADFGQGIAVDAAGNAYVTGSTESPDFPVANALQIGNDNCSTVNNTLVCSADAFVAKINPAGTALVYSTYLGGSGVDSGQAIAVDSAGDAYLAGYTYSSDFPTQSALQSVSAGGVDAFVSELDSSGSTLVFSTYLGGTGQDEAFGLTLDHAGDIYVTGGAESADFPTTPGVFQNTYGGDEDAFVTKIGAGGTSLIYSTLIGGSGTDEARGVAVDAVGNAAVVGTTNSTNFPTVDSLQRILGISGSGSCTGGVCPDAFVTLLNPTGGAVYSTYLGGTAEDFAQAVAMDSVGVPYVVGATQSTNFPAVAGALQGAYAGVGTSGNAFVAKIEATDAPSVALSPQAVNFGNQTLYVASSPHPVSLINAGSSPLQISGISATGDYAATSNCGTTLPAGGGTCTINVTYTPSTAGPSTAQVTIDDNAAGSPQQITVTGNGVTGGGGTLTLTPRSILFPVQAVGTTSPAQQVQIVNGSSSSVTITAFQVTGDFAETNNCGALPTVLNPNSSCTVSVTFTPTVSGTRTGTLSVTDNAAESPQSVTLSGSSAGPFTLSASAHASTVVVGTTSTTFTVSASAGGDFTSSITLSCTSANCAFSPPTITPGQSSTLTVTGLSATSPNPLNFTVNGKSGADSASLSLSVFFEDFLISAGPALRSINAGQSTTYTVTVSPMNGFNHVVLLACQTSLLPQGTTCSWSPTSGVTLDGTSPATATVTVATTTQQKSQGGPWGRKPGSPGRWWFPGVTLGLAVVGLGAVLAAILGGLFAGRKELQAGLGLRVRLGLLLAGIVLLAGGAVGCQTYGYNVIGAPTIIGTPTGSYVITISGTLGTDSTVMRSTKVNLSVSPG